MGKIKILQFECDMNASVNYNCKSFVCNLKSNEQSNKHCKHFDLISINITFELAF